MRYIKCWLNDAEHKIKVVKATFKIRPRGSWPEEARRKRTPQTKNKWPWVGLKAGEKAFIPWAAASQIQIHNSLRGYTRNCSGATFTYRSEPDGCSVWCLERKGR